MEAISMTLILERATIMPITIPKESANNGTHCQELPLIISSSAGALTLQVAESTWVSHIVSPTMVLDNTEGRAAGGTPHKEISRSSSYGGGFF